MDLPISWGKNEEGIYLMHGGLAVSLPEVLMNLIYSIRTGGQTAPWSNIARMFPDGGVKIQSKVLLHLPSFLAVFAPEIYAENQKRTFDGKPFPAAIEVWLTAYKKLQKDADSTAEAPVPVHVEAPAPAPFPPAPATPAPAPAPPAPALPSPSVPAPPVPSASVPSDPSSPFPSPPAPARVPSIKGVRTVIHVDYPEIGMMEFDLKRIKVLRTATYKNKAGSNITAHIVPLTKPWTISHAYSGYFRVEIPGLPMILARTCPGTYRLLSFILDPRHDATRVSSDNAEKYFLESYEHGHSFQIIVSPNILVLGQGPSKDECLAVEINNESREYLAEMFLEMVKIKEFHCGVYHYENFIRSYITSRGPDGEKIVRLRYTTPSMDPEVPFMWTIGENMSLEDLANIVSLLRQEMQIPEGGNIRSGRFGAGVSRGKMAIYNHTTGARAGLMDAYSLPAITAAFLQKILECETR